MTKLFGAEWTRPQVVILWMLVGILAVAALTFGVAVDTYCAINALPPMPR